MERYVTRNCFVAWLTPGPPRDRTARRAATRGVGPPPVKPGDGRAAFNGPRSGPLVQHAVPPASGNLYRVMWNQIT